MICDLVDGCTGVRQYTLRGHIVIEREAHRARVAEKGVIVKKRPDRDDAGLQLMQPLVASGVKLRLTDRLELCIHVSRVVRLLREQPLASGVDLRLCCFGYISMDRDQKDPQNKQ